MHIAKSISPSRVGYATWLRRLLAVGAALSLVHFAACSDSATEQPGTGGSGGAIPSTPCETEGQTDVCYPGEPLSANVGECRYGTTTCSGGVWGDCEGFVVPTAESCNELDDDCDGVVDDGCGGVGGGGGSGGAGGDGPTGWRLYERSFSQEDAFSSQLLSDVWVGANAPPDRDIIAADVSQRDSQNWLFVVDQAGNLYVRQGATWLLPRPVNAVFTGVDGAQVNALTLWRPANDEPQTAQFIVRGTGTQKLVYYFDVELPSLSVTPNSSNPIVVSEDTSQDAPAQHQLDCAWLFADQNAFLGTPHWVMFYMQYGTNAYELDGGDFTWADLGPAEQSSLWDGPSPTAPVAAAVAAAWLDGDTIHMVAP
ncbi:MAG: hypothetical protein JRI23_03905 [Deltaproteobacteria bacterium]|jgi:hypothetical protein|nr:hypothetical protein [Deltaproteobacteria bacterium]MBW2530673.1 hypothetical protein [Deltaproteobacteria bacterium]